MKKETTTTVNARVRTTTSSNRVVRTTVRKRVPATQSIEYVLPLGNGWVVKNNLASKFTVITDSKKEAMSIARKIAIDKRRELIVQGKNGHELLRENYQQ